MVVFDPVSDVFSLVRPLSLKVATDKNNLISSFRFSPSQPFYFLPWSEIKEQYDQTREPPIQFV